MRRADHLIPEAVLGECFEAARTLNGPRLVSLADPHAVAAFCRAELHLAGRDAAPAIGGLDAAAVLIGTLRRLPDALLDRLDCHPLGHIIEAPDLAHVVFRPRFPGGEPGVALGQFRRTGGAWRLCLEVGSPGGLPGIRGMLPA